MQQRFLLQILLLERFSSPVQTGPGPHPGHFPEGKAAGARRWPPTPI